MKSNRRDFLKKGALGTGLLFSPLGIYASHKELGRSVKDTLKKAGTRDQVFNMCGYAAQAIPVVRIGYVGIGGRGGAAVKRMTGIKGIEIRALCDIKEEAVQKGQGILKEAGLPEAAEYSGDAYAFRKMCEREDLDLVYITTSWDFHTPIATYAMEHGKHAATEVPAARDLEECWNLVETSERTRKHCMQLENVCYGFFELLTLNMTQHGAFGELVHAEGAYIHTLGESLLERKKEWRLKENLRNGNLYPTHGLGPVCQCLNINRGDRMETLVSVSTEDFQMSQAVKEMAVEDPYYRQFLGKRFRGNMNTSIVRTHQGKSIVIQHDTTSPRVYDRKHLLSGTLGMAQGYPLPGKIAFGHQWMSGEEMQEAEEKYKPELVRHIGEEAKKVGGHGGMDYIMDWRLIQCLRNGLPLDQDVYDAALWSSITPMSAWSISNGGQPIQVPDFTGGSWESNSPVDLRMNKNNTV